MTIGTTTHTISTLAQGLFHWKQDLVAAGTYSVVSSGDGLALYSSSGDIITTGSSGAGGLGNVNAWFRLKSTDSKYEILIQITSDAPELFFGGFVYNGATFSSGSPDPSTIAAPDDLLKYTIFCQGFFPFGSELPGGPYTLTVGIDDAAPYGHWFTFETGGQPVFGVSFQPVPGAGDKMVASLLDPSGTAFAYGSDITSTYGWNTITASIDQAIGGGGGPTDTTAPTITSISPSGGSITRTTSTSVDISDETALAKVFIWAEYDDGSTDVVYDGTSFLGIFAAGSSVSGTTYTVVPASPGYPASSVILRFMAVDTSGNETTRNASYTISNAPSAPVITNFIPSASSSMSRSGTVQFDVTDDEGGSSLVLIRVYAQFSDGTRLVYDGTNFLSPFTGGSSKTSISNGYQFVIACDSPGWLASTLRLTVEAVDAQGRVTSNTTWNATITNPPAAPVIGNFSPSDGSTIVRSDSISVDVTDDEGRTALALVTIEATLADGSTLVVYDGSSFPGHFSAGSSRSNISNGYRYTFAHDGAGFPSSTLDFKIVAVDAQGRTTISTSYNLVISNPPAVPTISSFSPAAGDVLRADAVDFTVTSADGFSKIVVYATLANGSSVLVYNGATFGAEVNSFSSVSGTTTKSFSVRYDGLGWMQDYTLHVIAIDSAGRSSSASSAYTLTDPPAEGVVDTTPPTISNVSPADMSQIQRSQAVKFQVTDDASLRRVFVFVQMGDVNEVAWDGYTFTSKYAFGSRRTAITGGFEFVVLRSGGWLAGPQFTVHPFDASGNEG